MKITTHICKTLDLGVSGNLFGGQLMYWLDEAASVYAIWATGEPKVVTRRISEASFHKPIHTGELLVFNCIEPRKGKTSFSFKVLVVVGSEIRFQAECTFVAVDEKGNKKLIDWSKAPISQTEEEFPG
ncbi:MAG: hypothetical protein J6S53_02780 [Lentisphaeria bacterium]|nr:hypothetical protein [Lentisphaeria bacterium]MBO7329630.1 hypothetical protein [Lentisphaeria bacterium]